MRVKELKRTVNVAWSPAELHPVYLAAGSAAQQVDASFSSNSYLELYSLNLEDPGYDLELKASLPTQHKFQKIVWSPAGILIAGCDGGLIEFYGAEKLINNKDNALLGKMTRHTGQVSALDVNPFQKNLIASGASDSEIFIWDLLNTSQPMAPGNKNQPYDHVQGLAWNQQVQHILGSTFSTRCVVWDLRKNEPIMKLSDSQSRTRWRSLAWHPSVATQVCIASEDDQAPVIQLWDLRLAASPLVTLEGHQKGVLALSWCRQDPDLLLSAGKDGRVLCWNPNNTKPGGELLGEVCQQQQWVFDTLWCPRNPALLVACSFDQRVVVHSLFGGTKPETSTQSQNNILDSFGGVDSLSQLPAVARAPEPQTPQAQQLPTPPRWMRTKTRAKFAFGGKLVTFEKCPQEAGSQKLVYISQVISEPEIVEKATELDTILNANISQDPTAAERLAEYCRLKGDAATDQNERYMWFFLRANFMPTFRSEVLNLLGFKQDEILSRFKGTSSLNSSAQAQNEADPTATLSRGESTETEAELSTDTSTDLSDAHTLIERKLANIDLGPSVTNVVIPKGEDSTSLICRALVSGNLEEAVELCLDAKRIADALIIASLGSQELVYKVQKYHLRSTASDPVSVLSGAVLQASWDEAVRATDASSWRDLLAAIVTHTDGEALAHYCETLGDKLSKESDPSLSSAAIICYLCAMSPDPLLAEWSGKGKDDASSLLRRAELALLTRRAAAARGRQIESSPMVDRVLSSLSLRLASQGALQTALNALDEDTNAYTNRTGQNRPRPLHDRIARALRVNTAHVQQQSHQYTQLNAQSRTRTVSGHSQKRGHVLAHNDVSNTYSAVPAQYEPSAMWHQASVPSAMAPPSVGSFPAPPAARTPPPRPGSVGPTAGGVLSGRSKYKVDPSVQSAPLYNQYSFGQPPQPQQLQPQPLQPQPLQPLQPSPYAAGLNSPLGDAYGAASVPSGGYSHANNVINPVNSAPMHQMNGGYYSPAPPSEPVPPPAASKPVPPGWNDPPMPSAKAKPKQEHQAQAPITHPLFGVEPPQHVPLNPAASYQQQYPGQQYPGQQYAGQQYPGQQFPEQQQYLGQYPPGATQGYPQQAESPPPVETGVPAAPAAPAAKAPLPEELQPMQSLLDAIRTECSNRATNPQMKRKLEDVQKKLETLYDMLREYRLSESAISTLQSCVLCAQSGDFASASAQATQLAAGADFAAAASFLPGLKVLFQLASQLQVYVR